MTILKKLNDVFGIKANQLKQNEQDFQLTMAPLLRKAAIDHLRKGRGIVGKGFCNEFSHVGASEREQFLQEQGRNGAWGTYIEACALGEMLDCHIAVTPVKKGEVQKTFYLHRSPNSAAATIHLSNSDNTHWFINKKTKEDGNCLYNAIAQALQQLARPLLMATNQNDAVEHQKEIASSIKSNKPSLFSSEPVRTRAITATEQKQIDDDYKLALQLAREEIDMANSRKRKF